MLQSIRDRSQGLIVGVIVFLISLTFALFGVQEYVNSAARVVVAEVEGEEIELPEFQNTLQRLRRQAESILGEAFDSQDWNTPEVRERALQELINDRLIIELAEDARIRISDRQVAAQIQRIPQFQDGEQRFSREMYKQRVPLLGFSELQFEQEMRNNLAKAQLRAGVAASEFVTNEEATLIERWRQQKRDIGYAIIPATEYEDELQITDAELETYYQENREVFRTDEKVTLRYLTIRAADLVDEVDTSDAVLKAYYENNKPAFTAEEQRNVNHILVQLPESAPEEDQAAALAKIEAILERAGGDEDFEKLAEELSDDVGSRAEGGETGFFPKGAMAPEFEEAAFALDVGEISEPVRTKFGYHLIKLKAVKPGGLRPFDEAREDVREAYVSEETQKMFFDRADQFSNLVYEHPDSLEVAAEALGLEIQTLGPVTREDIALEFSERVASTAFESEVLLEGLNSEPVELDDGRVVAVRVVEHETPRIPPLAEVREEVRAEVRAKKLRELTEAAGQAMIAKLRDGGTVTEIVTDKGFGWERAEAAGRDSRDVNRAVLRAAFRTEVTEGEPVYVGVPIGRSDYAIARIANPRMPDEIDLDIADVAAVKQQLAERRAAVTWQEFLKALRARSDVEIFSENL